MAVIVYLLFEHRGTMIDLLSNNNITLHRENAETVITYPPLHNAPMYCMYSHEG